MNYTNARESIKRQYTVKNGYSGQTTPVGLAFDREHGTAIEVANCGCYRANGRRYASEAEMLYYFDNHRTVHFPQLIRCLSEPLKWFAEL
jgi:hypothetical protein